MTSDTPTAHPYDRRGNTDWAAEQATPARTDGPTLQRYSAQAREGCMSEPVVSFVADPDGGWTRYDKAATTLDAAQAREDRLRAVVRTQAQLILGSKNAPNRVEICATRLLAALEDRADLAPTTPDVAQAALPDVDTMAQIIRKVDGRHDLGAGALAEAIIAALAEGRE